MSFDVKKVNEQWDVILDCEICKRECTHKHRSRQHEFKLCQSCTKALEIIREEHAKGGGTLAALNTKKEDV